MMNGIRQRPVSPRRSAPGRKPNPNNIIYAETIKRFYTTSGYTLRRISSILFSDYRVSLSKNQVKDILNSIGINTSKAASYRTVICSTCGSQVKVSRSKYITTTGLGPSAHPPWRVHCDSICRRVWLEEHCKGQAAARRMVAYIMDKDLPDGAVCHFIDNDTRNAHRTNIRVFTSTSRHLQEHRSNEVHTV